MNFEIVITRAAHQDTLEAYNFYEVQQAGLGERFLEAFTKRYADLATHPHHYSFIDEDLQKILRDVRLEVFPFVVVFEIIESRVIVYAIHHLFRNPKRKLSN